jgi:cell wall-associated NlpC family hydrolase
VSPAVANAKAVPDRLQGHSSDFDHLTLRDGRNLAVEVGGAILPTPTLKRTVGGGSTIAADIRDERLKLLDAALLSEDWDAEIDGLWFSYLGTKKAGTTLSITLEERAINRLRGLKGPKKVAARRGQPDEVTRAEFVISLIREVKPRIPFYCPQLHERQPIKSRSEGTKAKDDAKANRDAGIGDVAGLTVKGTKATKAQKAAADRALRVAQHDKAPYRVKVALMMALIVESLIGDADPNWLQVEPFVASAGGFSATDLEASVHGFLTGYNDGEPGAVGFAKSSPQAPAYEIAQHTQRSGAGAASNGAGNYGPWAKEASEWVDAFDGGEIGDGEDFTVEPFLFEVEKGEDYWTAIKRLAKDVNWRAFFVSGRFFFIDELELARGMVRLAIEREPGEARPSTPGIEDVDFDFNGNKPITTATVYAYAQEWSVPPGGVVTLSGYGPASRGFGDAPLRKGQKAAVSSARKASTGEGRGRYLVESIEGALTGDAEARLLTIKIRKPTAPLPEPANETTSTSSGDEETDAGGNATAQRVLEFCEGEVGKPYAWGAFGPDSYDCSGFVSKALNVGGFLEGRLTTSGLASWGEAGEGEFITVHDKVGTGSARTEHVLLEVLGEIFECGGMSGGVGRPNYSAGELAAFSTKRHPKGF